MCGVWCAELSKDGLVKTLQIRCFSTAFVEHPGDWCHMTNHANPEGHESNGCELMYVLCMRIFLLRARRHARNTNRFKNKQNVRTRVGITLTAGLMHTGGRAIGARLCGLTLLGNKRHDSCHRRNLLKNSPVQRTEAAFQC